MPVQGRLRTFLTIQNILGKISEYDIYRFYLGHDFKLGKAFTSPFRKETNPSFSIIVTDDGSLHHLDYGDSNSRGDCFNFVAQLYALSTKQALEKIDHDFGLGLGSSPKKDYKQITKEYTLPSEAQKKAHIVVSTRKFEKWELDYWNSYHLSLDDLKANDVYAIERIALNRVWLPRKPDELMFAYLFGDKWKIYKPLAKSKKEKWMMNVANDTMSGLGRVKSGDSPVIVTKAKKDELVLAKFLPHVCSVQTESVVSINNDNIALLQSCPKVLLNFDSDETGIQTCKYYNQFGFGWINCPIGFKTSDGKSIKDFADLGRYYGMDAVIAHFKRKGVI